MSEISHRPTLGDAEVMDDREVVTAIVAGNPAGLANAYDKYAASLYGYCRWMLHEPADAAGALQHTFAIAVTKLGGLQDPRKLRPWLYAMARQECHRRLSTTSPSSAADAAGQPADDSRDTGRAELRRLIRATVDELEPDEREVIELSLRHHLNDSDLAVVLGMPANRAYALASHALGQLEKALGMLLIARTGRTTCAALDELLAGWDGWLTSQMRGLVGRHIEECQACAGRRRGALRPEALSGLFPLATLPIGLREQVLGLCAGLPRDALTYGRRATPRAKLLRPAWFSRAARLVGRDTIRGNPGATTAAAAVVMWVVAAVIATVITFAGSHPAHALAVRTGGGAPAAASTPANIRGGTPASTRAGRPASPEHSNQPPGNGLTPAVTPVSPTEQAKPSPSPALSPAPTPSP
jgi:RNA polymerase sigma factor (sigma-70 family)